MSDLSSCHWCLEREKDLWLLREIDGNQDEIRTARRDFSISYENLSERNHRFLELIRNDSFLSLLISL